MEKEKQIEEMAKIAYNAICVQIGGGDFVEPGDRQAAGEIVSEDLYNAGYRKEEEVRKEKAREISAAELRHRLSELEDKLEAGRLVELPCKVGDTVYIVGRKYRAGSYESFINTGKFRYSDMEKVGDTVFLTREAAEARLKEMEEKET